MTFKYHRNRQFNDEEKKKERRFNYIYDLKKYKLNLFIIAPKFTHHIRIVILLQ